MYVECHLIEKLDMFYCPDIICDGFICSVGLGVLSKAGNNLT